MSRFQEMQDLLEKSKFFKLVCGAGNEDSEEVLRLSFIYTLAGAKGMDISANPKIVKSCLQGINLAISFLREDEKANFIKPFITVSVGMPGDHHVRKAYINNDCIKCNLCIPACPTDAIPNNLIVIDDKCIGCGDCSAVCPVDVIDYRHNEKELMKILPDCLDAGAEQIELHAAVKEDNTIMREWELINKINPNGHISMCLDRLHLSDFSLEERIKKAKEIAGNRLIIQADGYPMSGGEDDFNTTLQAVAIADVINKRFNKKIDRKSNIQIYKKKSDINILLSGGTNSLTAKLAKQNDVRFQGVSIGTFARKIVKPYIKSNDFFENEQLIKLAVSKAKELVEANIFNTN
jgi:ferredoxin